MMSVRKDLIYEGITTGQRTLSCVVGQVRKDLIYEGITTISGGSLVKFVSVQSERT